MNVIPLIFRLICTNSLRICFHSMNLFFWLLAADQVDAIHVTQLERDTVLVCLDSK